MPLQAVGRITGLQAGPSCKQGMAMLNCTRSNSAAVVWDQQTGTPENLCQTSCKNVKAVWQHEILGSPRVEIVFKSDHTSSAVNARCLVADAVHLQAVTHG